MNNKRTKTIIDAALSLTLTLGLGLLAFRLSSDTSRGWVRRPPLTYDGYMKWSIDQWNAGRISVSASPLTFAEHEDRRARNVTMLLGSTLFETDPKMLTEDIRNRDVRALEDLIVSEVWPLFKSQLRREDLARERWIGATKQITRAGFDEADSAVYRISYLLDKRVSERENRHRYVTLSVTLRRCPDAESGRPEHVTPFIRCMAYGFKIVSFRVEESEGGAVTIRHSGFEAPR